MTNFSDPYIIMGFKILASVLGGEEELARASGARNCCRPVYIDSSSKGRTIKTTVTAVTRIMTGKSDIGRTKSARWGPQNETIGFWGI